MSTTALSVALVTALELENLPRLDEQERRGLDATAYLKLHTPESRMAFYLTECDGHDVGYGWWVLPEELAQAGHRDRWHYVTLREMTELANRAADAGHPLLVRDWLWTPRPVREVIENT